MAPDHEREYLKVVLSNFAIRAQADGSAYPARLRTDQHAGHPRARVALADRDSPKRLGELARLTRYFVLPIAPGYGGFAYSEVPSERKPSHSLIPLGSCITGSDAPKIRSSRRSGAKITGSYSLASPSCT